MSTLLIRGVRVLDVQRGQYHADHQVLVDDGRIVQVAPNISTTAREVIDGTGLTLLPGLIDAHVHLAASSADLSQLPRTSPSYVAAFAIRAMADMVARGFTTVRDQGGADFGLAQAQAERLIPGPRIFFCGRALSQTGGHADVRGPGENTLSSDLCCPGMGRVVDGEAQVRAAARDELRRGAHHLKVMASGGVASPTDRVDSTQFSMGELRAVVEEAAAANRYVSAHAYTARAILRAVRAGVRSIEHGNLLDEASCEAMASHQVFLVPTLVTYDRLAADGRAAGLPDTSIGKVSDVLERGLGALEQAARAGVAIAFGSDLLGSMQPHQSREFLLRAQVQSPIDIIRSATVTAAELLGRAGDLGIVRAGATADLLLVDGDPLADITVLAEPSRHVRMVIQDGRVTYRAAASGAPEAPGRRN